MKKFTSFLLIFAMLISIIYLPGVTTKISAAGTGVVTTLPVGTMTAGSTSDNVAGYKEIAKPEEFAKIADYWKNGTKYFVLTSDIDLTTISFTTMTVHKDGTPTSEAIFLDGRGYKITTNKRLFNTLSAGSQVRNLVIEGGEIVESANTSGFTHGALAARSYGGYFKNIVLRNDVRYNNASGYVRVGGIIGMVLNGNVETFFENCSNSGMVRGGVLANGSTVTGTGEHRGGVGGICGHIHVTKGVYFLNCHYNRTSGTGVYNGLSAHSYAGGILGGNNAQKVVILNCRGSSRVSATTDYGTIFPNQQANNGTIANHYNLTNYHYNGNAVRIETSADFAKVLKGGECYAANGFIMREQNKDFTGTMYGFNRTISAYVPPFADMTKVKLENVNVAVIGWTRISNATEMAAIVNDGSALDCINQPNVENRYYLDASFSLPSDWKGPTNFNAYNSAENIMLDGCGFTITTTKPIFPELPGGGATNDGTHSVIRNLKINGTVSVNATQLKAYDNGSSVGALVGKANGGVFENITNNASVEVTGANLTVRAGGIIGSVFNDDITMTDCVNNGDVKASSTGTVYGVGGVMGLIGYNTNGSARGVNAKFINCVNNGDVTNTSTAASHVYAGGIIGVKYTDITVGYMVDCINNGKVFAKTAYGNYFANRLQQNMHVIKSTPIETAEDFMKISGHKAYSLANDITINQYNVNDFDGFLIGNGHTVTTPTRLFDYAPNAVISGVNVDVDSLVINGQSLSSFAVVASSASEASPVVNFVKSKYDVTLAVKTPTDNYVGNAIYINQGNTYGGVRYGFSYDLDGRYTKIYLNGKDTNATSTVISNFLTSKLTTTATAYDFATAFGQESFTYNYPTDVDNQGYTFNEADDRVHNTLKGVQHIDRTYVTSAGKKINVDIIIIKSDGDAHIEVVSAPISNTTCSKNSTLCGNKHLDPMTASELAAKAIGEKKNVVGAINGSFFMRSAQCYLPWGMQIVNGNVISEPSEGKVTYVDSKGVSHEVNKKTYSNWFGITKDGKPVIGNLSDYNTKYKGNILHGVTGNKILIKDGAYVKNDAASAARTAIGITANGDIVMVAISGREGDTTHPGATLADLTQVFMDLDMGITDAINLDGGGSTTMLYQSSDGELLLRTTQYSNATNTTQREIADIVAIVAN